MEAGLRAAYRSLQGGRWSVEKLIEACAEKIIYILRSAREVNMLRMPERVSERGIVVYQALGWLAREGRIRYQQRRSQVYVSLDQPCS